MRNGLFLAAIWCCVALCGVAQNSDMDRNPKWAVNLQFGPVWQVHTKNDFPFDYSKEVGMMQKVLLEYYIPATRFSLKGGYEHETLSFFQETMVSSLHQLSFGGRLYLFPKRYVVQAYVGADLLGHVGKLKENGRVETWASDGRNEISMVQGYTFRNPRFSVSPVVGLDIYILSSLALQVEYGYRMGMDAHYTICSQYPKTEASYMTESKGMRHTLGLGVKMNFPFRISEADGKNIFNYIWNGLFHTNY